MKLTPEQFEKFKQDLEILKSAHAMEVTEVKEDDIMGAVATVKVYWIVVNSGSHGQVVGYTFTQYGADTLREMLDNFLGNKATAREFSVDIDTRDPLYLNDGMVKQMIANLGRR